MMKRTIAAVLGAALLAACSTTADEQMGGEASDSAALDAITGGTRAKEAQDRLEKAQKDAEARGSETRQQLDSMP